uniref:Uncharacterized protein n=1 Tax=Solanum lycopersicum TaxID=4081 RepID=A0A3Q7GH30_SOLLC
MAFFSNLEAIKHGGFYFKRLTSKFGFPKKPDPLKRLDELHGHDWWFDYNQCNKIGEESFWYSRLQGLREEYIQWSTDSLVIADIRKFATDHENGRVKFAEDIIGYGGFEECWVTRTKQHQHRHSKDAKVKSQLKQELQGAKQCMKDLDDSMEQQIHTLDGFKHQEGSLLASDHLWENKYSMWEEFHVAKRTRLREK